MPKKPTGRPPGRPPYPDILTPAEQRVLGLLREGLPNAEIAVRLGISPDGVKYHVSNMLSKLHLERREQLAAWRPSRVPALGRLFAAIPLAWRIAGGATLAIAGGGVGILAYMNLPSNYRWEGVISVGYDGSPANGVSEHPVVSADGRFVAFASTASNLVLGDTNAASDVFVADTKTRKITRVSLADDGAEANGASYDPTISADGSRIAFTSIATNLTPDRTPTVRPAPAAPGQIRLAQATQPVSQVYLRDLRSARTMAISLAPEGQLGDMNADRPSISPDGRTVAFDSIATNLVPGDTNLAEVRDRGPARFNGWDVFVRKLDTGALWRVTNGGGQLSGATREPRFSADGKKLIILSKAEELSIGHPQLRIQIQTQEGESTDPLPRPYVVDLKSRAVTVVDLPDKVVSLSSPMFTPSTFGVGTALLVLGVQQADSPGSSTRSSVLVTDARTGQMVRAWELEHDAPIGWEDFAVSGDDNAILMAGVRPESWLRLYGSSLAHQESLHAASPRVESWSTGVRMPAVSHDAHVVAAEVRGEDVRSGSDTSDIYIWLR